MLKQHGERCGEGDQFDDEDDDCPICRGDVSSEFTEWLLGVVVDAEANPGKSMTGEEVSEWLRSL